MSATIEDTAGLLSGEVQTSPASTRALPLLWVAIVRASASASTRASASASSTYDALRLVRGCSRRVFGFVRAHSEGLHDMGAHRL